MQQKNKETMKPKQKKFYLDKPEELNIKVDLAETPKRDILSRETFLGVITVRIGEYEYKKFLRVKDHKLFGETLHEGWEKDIIDSEVESIVMKLSKEIKFKTRLKYPKIDEEILKKIEESQKAREKQNEPE